jgi:N utilization substance protein B
MVSNAPSHQQQVDPRHARRVEVMQQLFAYDFYSETLIDSFKTKDLDLIIKIGSHLSEIDKMVQRYAPERPIKDINKVDLSILRLAVYEHLYTKTPPKVLIDEAVEMAKEFGSETSQKFVNGVLGKIAGIQTK